MDGIIIINKHKGCTSHDIVHKVKKILNNKVGHTGTLDPLATGVLPLLVGKGTLCSKYLINHDKRYKVVLELGKKTDTADSEGNIIQIDTNFKNKDIQTIENVLKNFIGKQEQIPPMYSAIKVNGKKLYEYARKGQKIDIPSRNIEIYNIKLINIKNNQIQFEVSCSKGTYIRSLCEDIAKKMGTIGYMKELERLLVGNFTINDSITLDELEKNKDNNKYIENHFITIEQLFADKDNIQLDSNKLQLFLNGVKLTNRNKDGIYKIYNNETFIGIGIIKDELLKRDIILNEPHILK